jgi:hypothetical protein
MVTSRIIVLGLLLVVLIGLRAELGGIASSQPADHPALTGKVKRAGLRFAPGVVPSDRQLVLGAIAGARPEARRLVDLVDGLVTVDVGGANSSAGDAVGVTRSGPGGFQVTLDLASVWREAGMRGVQRLVLHELGHVVDGAIVPAELERALVAEVPLGYGCDEHEPTGSCAPPKERFAETFAKWATGDIGVNVPLGYKVLPPDSLEDWGAQLVRGVRIS